MATRRRRTDLDRNVFYAAAAAIIPKKVLENKQVRAVMRLKGLSHDAIIKAVAMRTNKDDQCCGWEFPTTAGHHGTVAYSPLGRWFHSSAVSTEGNEVKKQIRVGETIGEDTKVCSYQLHNRRPQREAPDPSQGLLGVGRAKGDGALVRAGGAAEEEGESAGRAQVAAEEGREEEGAARRRGLGHGGEARRRRPSRSPRRQSGSRPAAGHSCQRPRWTRRWRRRRIHCACESCKAPLYD
jgi:hypothetical protein